ncbi:hypothetical protein [uncultured Acinetobacter sp.]|uniref:hypothetical protein n=1 Tax=uncultured Acinetobacter sp. TaxID=165433 RepID=UPI002587CAF2|nr:hypothetical protein [uncultured Acinetobacter sp.]
MMSLNTYADFQAAKALIQDFDSRMYIERDSFFDNNFDVIANENELEQLRTAVNKIEFKPGSYVYVDFTHQLEKDSSEIHFQGKGVLDRVEDGRVYGRLDDGRTFTCLFDDILLIATNKYDWSNVDSRINWIAKDCDSRIYRYAHKPSKNPWGFGLTNGFAKRLYLTSDVEWSQSLEHRPEGLSI